MDKKESLSSTNRSDIHGDIPRGKYYFKRSSEDRECYRKKGRGIRPTDQRSVYEITTKEEYTNEERKIQDNEE